MDAMLNKSKKNKGVAESSLADPGRSGVNGSRTKPKIDTPLTQPRSGPVLDGYVMEPERRWEHQIASIICGHASIQRLEEYDHDSFEMFVREVLRTNARP